MRARHDSQVLETGTGTGRTPMVMFGRTVRIAVWSRNGLWKRGVGAATFTARGIGIVRWGRGLGRRIANARRCERRSSMYLPIKKRWGGSGSGRWVWLGHESRSA